MNRCRFVTGLIPKQELPDFSPGIASCEMRAAVSRGEGASGFSAGAQHRVGRMIVTIYGTEGWYEGIDLIR